MSVAVQGAVGGQDGAAPDAGAASAKQETGCMAGCHWSRAAFGGLFSASLIFTILYGIGVGIPTILVVIIFIIGAALGCALVWNYAVSKSLAESAERLKNIMLEGKKNLEMQRTNNEKARENNDRLKKNNEEMGERLDKFKDAVQLLNGEVKDLNAVEQKLQEVFQQNAKIQERRKELSKQQKQFLYQQEIDSIDREREDLKRRLRDQFDDADRDRDGYISEEAELNKMKKFLAKHKIDWNDIVEEVDPNKDGKIERWELMDALEKLLDDRFNKLKVSAEERFKSQEDLKQKTRELEKLRRQVSKIADQNDVTVKVYP